MKLKLYHIIALMLILASSGIVFADYSNYNIANKDLTTIQKELGDYYTFNQGMGQGQYCNCLEYDYSEMNEFCSYSNTSQYGNMKLINKELAKDEVYILRLPENPSTGYTWHYSTDTNELGFITDKGYHMYQSSEGLLGSGGYHEYYIKSQVPSEPYAMFYLAKVGQQGLEEPIERLGYHFTILDENTPLLKEIGISEVVNPSFMSKNGMGYKWIAEIEGDSANIEYVNYDGNQGYNNIGPVNTWYIKGTNPGISKVRFTYWDENSSKALMTREYILSVNENPNRYIPQGYTQYVMLNENPTAGYVWHYKYYCNGILQNYSQSQMGMKMIDKGFTPYNMDPMILGSPGMRIWELSGTAPCYVNAEFKLYSPNGNATQCSDYECMVIPDSEYVEKTIKIGDTFEISLNENPTTGYEWQYVSDNKLELLSEEYMPNKNTLGIVGQGGSHTWKFKAVEEGISTLKFMNGRIFENTSVKNIFYEIKIIGENYDIALESGDSNTINMIVPKDKIFDVKLYDGDTDKTWKLNPYYMGVRVVDEEYLPDKTSENGILPINDTGYNVWRLKATRSENVQVLFEYVNNSGYVFKNMTYNLTIMPSYTTSYKGIGLGQEFILELPENPTTGYTWYWHIDDEEIINLTEEKYIPNDIHIIGSGGNKFWIFEGLEKGTTNIKFEYKRSWEDEPILEYLLTVYVN
ncbi:protease inhibitor I42 family protein [Methanococcus voltae]|uniref:Proteinase inhibitor I42, chagasin n=1 Tax=Methanococcus voltae (strain ATCC BAA-1334 / A3) TaxID=456320 RepID=D7DU57_METV3|nr:protease inhibitor I42 family protein [Methanococcus voltae]MCS3900467.1 inhibitor of cysteine peptidase [Methanococcus voltae]